jgi:hypothetical protein
VQRGKVNLVQRTVGALFFKIIFMMPVILKLYSAVPERLIHCSFAVTMKPAENIVDYKVLYDELRIKYDELELRFEGLTQQLAQMKKMIFGSRPERFVPTDDNKPGNEVYLHIDLKQRGLGGDNSWGPLPHQPYRMLDKKYSYSYVIRLVEQEIISGRQRKLYTPHRINAELCKMVKFAIIPTKEGYARGCCYEKKGIFEYLFAYI